MVLGRGFRRDLGVEGIVLLGSRIFELFRFVFRVEVLFSYFCGFFFLGYWYFFVEIWDFSF